MTVQFILPEAISFPKERKLHDRLFLVLLYNLLCKTFKDHSSTFAASSRIRAHPSLARALLPDCECKGRAFLHSLQDFDEKKCEKNSFAPILPLHSIAKSAVKSIFSLDPLPAISHPKPPFFVRFGHFGSKIHLFRDIFLFDTQDFLARNLILHRQNQLDGEFLFGLRRISTFADEDKEERRWLFSPSPTPLEKYKPTFSQNFSTFRDFLPCFSQNLPTPTPTPIQSYAQDTRLRVYTRPRIQRICHFCLHPSPHPATNCRSTA